MIGQKIERKRLRDAALDARLNYFHHMAQHTGITGDDGTTLLGAQYDHLQTVRSGAVLVDYLRGETAVNTTEEKQPLAPFGWSLSQRSAIANALSHKISIIQGPPGTGKTQTVLNIIANVVLEGKTVAVVSNNNSATDNVYEKLQTQHLEFIAARLGSRENKQAFIDKQSAPPYAMLRDWLLDDDAAERKRDELRRLDRESAQLLAKKNMLATLTAELDELTVEREQFHRAGRQLASELPLLTRRAVGMRQLLDAWHRLQSTQGTVSYNIYRFWWRLYLIIFYGKRRNGCFRQQPSLLIRSLQAAYYQARVKELQEEIAGVKRELERGRLDEKMQRHRELSMEVFRSRLARYYRSFAPGGPYTIEDLRRRTGEFVRDYPVILSTTHSLRSSLSQHHIYDYVIVDEASQVDLVTFALALSCARRVVVVGDSKQLPNVIDSSTKFIDGQLARVYEIDDPYRVAKHSALSSIVALFGNTVPSQLLREHYRCHPKIIGFCNKMFYNNQLIVLTPPDDTAPAPLKVYETVAGNHARDNHVNQRQIDVTLGEVVPNEGLDLAGGQVGIVTPYRNQAAAMQAALRDSGLGESVLAATVDKFQGRERDVMIMQTVDNQITDFASNPQRLNVAVSRARRQLILVTNGNHHVSRTGIDELVNYIKYNNYQIVSTKTRSVFDYLYTAYYKHRKLRQVSKYYSENLAFDMIEQVIAYSGLGNLRCVVGYPLKYLCDLDMLTGRELSYASNGLTRVDFVIITQTAKLPVLAIEVDGYHYHHNPKQQERDGLKDALLARAGIPLLRLATTGSGEYEKVMAALKLYGSRGFSVGVSAQKEL